MLNGLVINTQKNIYFVKTGEHILQCSLRGKLLNNREKVNSPVIVGDMVQVEATGNDRGIIFDILPRKSKFSRQLVGAAKGMEQLIAANVDQLIIVCSVKDPRYKLNGIDRYIVAAKAGGLEPVICFNKVDLVEYSEITEDVEHYRKYGFKVVCTSTSMKTGIDELKEILTDRISVFSGSSGVGKSSLVNLLEDEEIALTANIGSINRKGRHTTTSTHLYDLPFGGMVLDTPGMRSFGLYEADSGIKGAYIDIEELAVGCKFRNCSHTHEPGCNIKSALERGEIEEQRYQSFIKLARR
jgi:ribosome biogenesis GTPase